MHRTRLAAASMALLVAGATLSVAGPAFADDTTSSLAPCTPAASAPLYTARCAPEVTGTLPQVIVTLPGVGVLTCNLTNQNTTIDTSVQPTVSLMPANNNFSAGTPKISADGTRITVSFVNIAKPAQHYSISVKVSPPVSAGGPPVLKAVAGPKHNGGDENEGKDDDQQGANEHDDDAAQGANKQGQQGQQEQQGDDGGDAGGHGGGGD
jgi:hypothetical protein